jgi:hypothetical protein
MKKKKKKKKKIKLAGLESREMVSVQFVARMRVDATASGARVFVPEPRSFPSNHSLRSSSPRRVRARRLYSPARRARAAAR